MAAQTKTLTENIKVSPVLPRRLQNAELSTNSKIEIFYGTYQQVVNALDVNGIPEHKVKGFAFISPGLCEVIVHKH
jgi:hypothetical protein